MNQQTVESDREVTEKKTTNTKHSLQVNLSKTLIPSFNIPSPSCFLVCQLPWDQTQNYIRSGHRNPEDFDPETLKTITLSEEEGIQAVIGKPWNKQSTEVISYLFNKEKGWTIEKAKEWFKEHE